MKKTLLILILFAFLLPVTAQKKKDNTDPRLVGLDSKLETLLAEWKTPGFAVAIVEKNKVIYAKGFGYRDCENKIPVTPNTLFAIGSCTKAFTASLLGLLMEEDKLNLDESPRKYLPELKFYNHEMDNLITIRDLMCHRTGLPSHDWSWYAFPTDSKDSLVRRIEFQEPSYKVREKYQYNNLMFVVQGLIVEKVTGLSWEENVIEKIFKPLGMAHSNLSIESLEESNDAAFGYTLKNDSKIEKVDYYHLKALSPAGSINSSVVEMANWLITWIYGGKFEGKVVIPSSYISEAISSQVVVSASLPSKENPDQYFLNYGLGWGLSSYRGHYRVQHSGGIDGFSAHTCFFPTDSIGIVVLVNQDVSLVPTLVRNIIAAKMLKLSQLDWNSNMKSQREKTVNSQKEAESKTISNRKSGTVPSQKLSSYTGKYFNPGYETIKIVVERDSLFAITPLFKYWLKHYHYDTFQPIRVSKNGIEISENDGLLYKFSTNDLGEIESICINMEETVADIIFKRPYESIKNIK